MKKALDAINDTGCQYLRDRLAFYDPASPLLQGDRDLLRLVFYQTAIITAMYHDLGYPWQFMEQMHSLLKDDILLCGRLPKGSQVVTDYIAAHHDELMFRPFYNYGKNGLTTANINEEVFDQYLHTSHGLPGALAYWAYNDKFFSTAGEQTAGLIKFCHEWSCLAILMHDMQKAYAQGTGFARLDFKSDPLSFIIALADTLEDFNRPNASINTDKTGKGCLITYSFPSLSVELIENGGVGMLKFAIVEEERANQETFKRNDQRNLFDEGGYFDLASVGLSSMTIDVK